MAIWTSRAEYSDLLLLLARSDKSEKKDSLSLFLIDMRPHINKNIFINQLRLYKSFSTEYF